MNKDQALAKIKKCLALAKSSNPHEAAAAMRQAQKLMAEHEVSDQDITLADVSEAKASARSPATNLWEVALSGMVAQAFGCETYCVHHAVLRGFDFIKKLDYVFVGTGTAPEVACYTYDVLSRQCAKDRLAHIRKQPKNCKPITKTARGDEFALGWVRGVERLIERFSGTEKNELLLEQYMAQKYPNMKTTKVKDRTKGRNVSHNDRMEGIQAGRGAQLNRGVGGAAQQGMLQ